VPGNHDIKLLRKLRGKDVQITHGLANTLAELDALPRESRGDFTRALAAFLDGLVGSRAIVVLCQDELAARTRFGIEEGEQGVIITRTGRAFFQDQELQRQFLERMANAMTSSGFWTALDTSWACLDCELMPWSAKAQELIRTQYAAVGAAGSAALPHAVSALSQAASRVGGDEQSRLNALADSFRGRLDNIERFGSAYRRYCWPVTALTDLKLAPFHILATEGRVHVDKDHVWHMTALASTCTTDRELLLPTRHLIVDVTDPSSQSAGIAWWQELTDSGGEGMVVKPLTFVHKGPRGPAQPAIKCRGKEYLRIIYGPDYTNPENLSRLRSRGLARKRALALSEFALGIEALERFVRREPLRRVHECVFGVLALESEPVDPRL
jgi:hypothetical protein